MIASLTPLRGLLSLSACLLTPFIVVVACSPAPEAIEVRGHILQMSATLPKQVSELGYSESELSYALRPRSSASVLVTSKVTVSNSKAALTSLLIDERAVSLEDETGKRYRPVNPLERREAVARPISNDNTYAPYLWGISEVFEGYSVSGWLYFEVPRDTKIRGLVWDQVETLRVFFPDQKR